MACKLSLIVMISALALTSFTEATPGKMIKSINTLLGQVEAWNSKGETNTATILQSVRRLEEAAGGPPAACVEACPGAADMAKEMGMGEGSEGMSMTKATLEKVFNAICSHKDTMLCMESNKAACSGEDDHSGHDHSGHDHSDHDEGGEDMNFLEMGECLCLTCPSLKEGFINFYGTMMESMSAATDPSAPTPDPTQQAQIAMKALCPLLSGLKCASGQTECASVTKGNLDVTMMGGLDAISKVCPADTVSSTTSLKLSAWIATVAVGFSFAI